MDDTSNAAGGNTGTAGGGPAVSSQAEPGFDVRFLDAIKKYFSIETLREFTRVTPRGLFVEHRFRDRLVEGYQQWLESIGLPPAARTTAKIQRRIFAEDSSVLFYLAEGKLVMAGYLADAQIQQPQRYQLPYFLGSLSDSRAVLNPHDPVFQKLDQVSATQSAGGLQIIVQLGQGKVVVTTALLKEFLQRAEQNHRTLKDFPELKNSQAELLTALVTLLRKAKVVPLDKEPRLLPANLLQMKKISLRAVGSYEFIIDAQDRLIAVLDLRGKNLTHFVLKEMLALRQKGQRRIGIFDIGSERDRFLGIFNLRGKKFRLATHALAGFVEHVGDSPEKRDRFVKNYSVRDCFEKFSTLYQTAQPIESRLIKSFVADFKRPGTRFFVNGPWIFVLSGDGLISHTIARHHR